MVEVRNERAEKTKRWNIPDKFINKEFADYILNINELNTRGKYVSGLRSESRYFQLKELHGIYVEDIVDLFKNKGCGRIIQKNDKDFFEFHHQNLAYLGKEIRARTNGK